MATVTTGYTFVNNETVTPAKLNSLAGGASVTNIQTADIANGQVTPAKLSTGGPSWDANGRVGIGTSSPTAPLEIVGNLKLSGTSALVSVESSSYPQVQVRNTAAPTDKKYFRMAIDPNGLVDFNRVNDAYNSATSCLTISANNNVGIGTSNPGSKLDIQNGSSEAQVRIGPSASAGYIYGNSTAMGIYAPSGGSIQVNRTTPTVSINGTANLNGYAITNSPTTAKAWVRFTQTGAIFDAYNISTVTNFGGASSAYRIFFTNPMPDVNYVVVACPNVNGAAGPGDDNLLGTNGSIETTYFDMVCSDFNNGSTNPVLEQISIGMVIVFGR
jgi:hypothetical protein